MPPAHCEMLRHSSREGATLSGRPTVDVPVVVKPAIDSKKASVGPMSPERTKGAEPNAATPSHPRTTIKYTSRPET